MTLTHSLASRILALALALLLALPAFGQPPGAAAAADASAEATAEAIAEALQDVRGFDTADFLEDALVLPIFAILMVFGTPPLTIIVVARLLFRHRETQRRLNNERLQRFLEAGQPIPEAFLKEAPVTSTPVQHLNGGLLLLGIGLGFGVFLGLVASWKVASLALVLIFAGLARLLSWKLAGPQA